MQKYPSSKELKVFIEKETGIAVDSVDSNPVFLGSVSLTSFGFVGYLSIYRGDDGLVRAAPVPFGLTLAQDAA